MATLTTIYWLCFGIGLVYVLVAGTLGAVSHGMEAIGGDGDVDFDHDLDCDHGGDFDFDFDADLDADAGFDLDIDADLDVDIDADHDSGFAHDGHGEVHDVSAAMFPDWTPVSPLGIAGFLCAFGGAGLAASGKGISLIPSLAIAIGAGTAMAMLLWLVIGKWLYSMQGTSQARQGDMIGLEAEVLTPIGNGEIGEIAYVLGGVRHTAPAKMEGEGMINKRETVRIRTMKDNVVYVEKKRDLLV